MIFNRLGLGRAIFWAIGLAFGLVVALHAYLITYAYPQADDFCYWAQLLHGESLASIATEKWTGRAIANLLILSPQLITNWIGGDVVWWTRVILWLNLGIFIYSCWFAIGLAVRPNHALKRLLMTLGFASLFLINAYTVNEGFFWLSGAIVYFLGLPSLILVVHYGLRMEDEKDLRFTSHLLLTAAVVIGSFFNELYALAFAMVFAAILAKRFVVGKNLRLYQPATAYLLLAVICFLLNALSAGMSNRVDAVDAVSIEALPKALGLSAYATLTIYLEILSISVLAWASWLVLESNSQQPSHDTNREETKATFVWGALILLLPMGLLLGFVATGVPLPARALNLLQFAFVLGVSGIICSQKYKLNRWFQTGRNAAAIAMVIFSITVLFDRSVPILARDALIEGRKFSSDMANRITMLAGPQLDIVLPHRTEDSRLLLFAPQEYEPTGFRNRCLANYFEKQSVRLHPLGCSKAPEPNPMQ